MEKNISLEQVIAMALCYRSIGDAHAIDVKGNQRWTWYIEDAEKFIKVYGHELEHFGSNWNGVRWTAK